MNKRELTYKILHRELGDRFELNYITGTTECRRYHQLMRLDKAKLILIAYPGIKKDLDIPLDNDYFIDILIH